MTLMFRTKKAVPGVSLLLVAIWGSIAGAQNARTPEQILADWDTDRDGRLSEMEFLARSKVEPGVARRDFRMFDPDLDGFLGPTEFATQPTVFSADRRGPVPDLLADYVAGYVGRLASQFPDWEAGG